MLLVSKSKPEINVEETVGKHELSVVPRSLMAILENLPTQEETVSETAEHQGVQGHSSNDEIDIPELNVALVDAMAEVQALDKPEKF